MAIRGSHAFDVIRRDCEETLGLELGVTLSHVLEWSRHPTPEDALLEITRTEMILLMLLRTLSVGNTEETIRLMRSVDDLEMFPRVDDYIVPKLRAELNIPRDVVRRAVKYAQHLKRQEVARVPTAFVNFVKELYKVTPESPASPVDAGSPPPDQAIPSTSGTGKGPTRRKGSKNKTPAASAPQAAGASGSTAGEGSQPSISAASAPQAAGASGSTAREDIEPSSQNLGSCGQFRQWHQGSTGSKTQQNSVESRRHEYSMPNKYALLGDDKKPAPPMMSNRKSTASSLEKERAVQSVRDGGGGGGGGGNIQDSDGWMISATKFRHVTFEASKLQHLKDIEPSSQNLGSSGQFRLWHQGSAGSKTQQNSVESRRHEYSMPNKYALLGDDKKPGPPMMSNRKSTASSLEKERAVQSVRDGGGGGGGGGNIQDSDGWMISATKFRHVTFEASKLQHLKDIEPSSQNLGSSGQFRQWHQGSAGSKTQQNSVESRRHEYSMPNKYALLGDDKKPGPPMMSNRKSTASSLEKERAVQSVRDVLTSDRTSRNQSSNPSSRDSSQARSSTKPSGNQTVWKVLKKKSRVLFEEWVANHNVVESIDDIKEAFQEPIVFVKFVMEKVLEAKEPLRIAFSELLSILLEKSVIAGEDVAKEFRMLIEIGDDLAIDIPFVWKILGQMLAPPMVKGVFTFADLKVACEGVRTSNLSITTAEIINKLLKEKGPVFIKTQWETSKVEFSDFIPEDDVKVFIKNNSFGFIIGDGEIEAKEPIISMHDVENKLYDFLSQDGDKVFDLVCKWVKANVGSKSQDADFIMALMRAVIKVCTKNEKIVPASLNKHSTLIKKFLDANEMKELACLDGVMDVVVNDMESPVGLLLDVFQILKDNNIISIEAFLKWKIHMNNKRGKGVALACLAAFFVSICEQVSETDEDST